ncbi:hypothetical protein NCS57_00863800 [Neofusicoccum parvum]|nr:hypothetical protein NCS57_00863800 [Neofusicoccum parvum]
MLNKILSTTLYVSATGALAYTFITHRRISSISKTDIRAPDDNSKRFKSSHSVTSIVNPHGHPAIPSSRSISLSAFPIAKDLSDEQILARFVKGFFGGWVIGPERTILRLFRPSLVHFPTLKDAGTPISVWSPSSLSPTTLPAKNTVLFGTFQVLDVKIEERGDGETESFVDVGFGLDSIAFAGVHRFAVVRREKEVDLVYEDMCCNPVVDKPLRLGGLHEFHKVYAMLLFREGVADVCNGEV